MPNPVDAMVETSRRVEVRVDGVVQGVGFRPFVHGLATRCGLSGHVGNDPRGVVIDIEGEPGALARFLAALETDLPPLAAIERVSVSERTPCGVRGFRIEPSTIDGPRRTLVSADAATCDACLAELFDPADRRYRYPFLNCTDCGPRFTIVRDLPYDRANTTMSAFPLCAACAREYHDPADRRFHAQPVCCPDCGPRAWLVAPGAVLDDLGTAPSGDDAVRRAGELLRNGFVVAVKGLGGYHLAADARDEDAVARLRQRKRRPDKPFAVLVADVAEADHLCVVDDAARAALTGRARPIVLLDRRTDGDGPGQAVAESVAPRNRQLGLLLPYTPLHHLLLRETARPLVLTSGNVSDDPLVHTDADALSRLSGIADAFLLHDRPVHIRADDSVVRTWRGRGVPVRRSRGLAPEPVTCAREFVRPVLAVGAELKNTVCLGAGRRAVLSQHIGDLTGPGTLRVFTETVEHLARLFDVTPAVLAHDLHPDYASTRYALDRPGVELVGVQHHHAHIASCLAENGEAGPVIGVAFDGTGYGTDGTVWGGEFLLATLTGFERLGHLAPVPLPGGDAAVRQPWRMAAAHLTSVPEAVALGVARRHGARWEQLGKLIESGVNTPSTSSVGRLFDAVAAVLDIRDTVTYEGQAAVELEQHADRHHTDAYPVALRHEDGRLLLDGADLVRTVVADRSGGTDVETVAARFHNALAGAVGRICRTSRERTGVSVVALSGGVFANRLLLERTVTVLESERFRVLTHSRVPCNDGGISLGQVSVAGARDREDR